MNKNYLIILLCALMLFSNISIAQKYWVFLTDKRGVSFDPYEYFDEKAIERRLQNGISLYDTSDFPLKETYIIEVSNIADSLMTKSRWFNAVSVIATYKQIEKIKTLDCVKFVEPIIMMSQLAEYNKHEYDTSAMVSSQDIFDGQTSIMKGNLFYENGYDGTGVRIAIFDGGFPTVDYNIAFEHIRKDERIIKTWDFVKNKEFVYSYSSHGTAVLSCIAGMVNEKHIGLATGAEFLLARTEIGLEPFSEEENWLAAVEWADKNGADIINSSLGYTHHRYFPEQMDGKTSLVSRAANIAAAKGILVINAAGNEGSDKKWKYIGTPADADSILSIGGIDPKTNIHINFSSYGPTTDKRMKPNVCAYGYAIVAGKKKLKGAYGTSFSSPLVAGFAACAWQTNRNLTNMDMFYEIQKSGSLYPYFDYAHGYGIPQASYFIHDEKDNKPLPPSFKFEDDGEYISIIALDFDKENPAYLYYNIQNKDGYLDKYSVLEVYQKDVIKISKSSLEDGKKINVHYKSLTLSYAN